MPENIVIIGGVAGGATAACRARRYNENATITIYERSGYIAFANCGIPYYIGGTIQERDKLLVQTPESLWARYKINVNLHHEALQIDPTLKQVSVKNLETGELIVVPYDKLVVSTGSTPVKPKFIAGLDLPEVFTLWNIEDTDHFYHYLEQNKPQQGIVLGGGFIGLEVVEALVQRGIKVSVADLSTQILQPYDPEMTIPMRDELEKQGVMLYLGKGATAVKGTSHVEKVQLTDGTELQGDFVILSIGVKSEIDLLKNIGLTIGHTQGIATNGFLETSIPDIYVAGDIVETVNLALDRKERIPLAAPANKQGRVVGTFGKSVDFKGALGTNIVKVFDKTIAKTGYAEKEVSCSGEKYQVSYTISPDHASYYPGAEPLTTKLIYEKETGKIVGAQVVGSKGVDKQIDVLATLIYFKGTVYDLEQLDLAYSPPYNSAKSPANIAGYVGSNILRNEMLCITPLELLKDMDQYTIIDVRTKKEFEQGALPHARHIDVNTLRDHIGSLLDGSQPIAVYCKIGLRGYIAQRILLNLGFKKIYNVTGGYTAWKMVEAVYMKELQKTV